MSALPEHIQTFLLQMSFFFLLVSMFLCVSLSLFFFSPAHYFGRNPF